MSNYDLVGNSLGVNRNPTLTPFSTTWIEQLRDIALGKACDPTGTPVPLHPDIIDMMFPFGSKEEPQMVVCLAPASAELIRYGQMYGVPASAWSSDQRPPSPSQPIKALMRGRPTRDTLLSIYFRRQYNDFAERLCTFRALFLAQQLDQPGRAEAVATLIRLPQPQPEQ